MAKVVIVHQEQSERHRTISCRVSGDFPSELRFEASFGWPTAHGLTLCDWIAVGLIYPAMSKGEPLEIEGPVSPRLLFHLNNDLQSLLVNYDPALKKIPIVAHLADIKNEPAKNDVATGFSAGIDSFSTLSIYLAESTPRSLRPTILTIFDVGAMGPRSSSEPLFRKYSSRLGLYAQGAGLKTISMRSNLDEFYDSELCGFQRTHVLRNACAALFFSDLVSTVSVFVDLSLQGSKLRPQ